MTNDQKGRRQTDARARYRKMADEVELGTITRSHLQVLAKDLPQTGLVNSTEALLLVTLVHSAPAKQFEPGGMPIVFKSNATLAFEIRKSPNHTGALLSRLFDAGLVAMRDSGNYKRFARRDEAGNLASVSGIDLRVLVARYEELNALVALARSERNAKEAAWSEYRGAVRQLHLVLSGAEDLAGRILASLKSRFDTILANASKRSPATRIEQATRLCRWLAERAYGLRKGRKEAPVLSKIMSTITENRDHIQTTNLNHSVSRSEDKRRPAHAGQVDLNGASFARWAWDERGGDTKSSPKAPAEPARPMQIKTLTAACPALAMWLGTVPTSWPALIDKYPLLCSLVGISPDARDLAARVLGQRGAAMAAALIIERREAGEIKSAGGFMRALIDRASTGDLHLEKSIYARAKFG
ncbi:replication initiation protein RepC [Devosia sp. LC5]|uniref:plasmid replication protein RepC n=1 Tax=Devosia sp. LC5 TaxID=1502724 RepID=UPI0004E3F238|nr:plasmid replication protein RepC [Devosia sp. LC5]KFC70218.1 replication initiation protein RepC [Devosia sp. LC5]